MSYRDAWAALHRDEPGHTFTPENTLTTTAEAGEWELELGRRIDHILLRCGNHGPTLDISACRRLLDTPVGGVWASDHFRGHRRPVRAHPDRPPRSMTGRRAVRTTRDRP